MVKFKIENNETEYSIPTSWDEVTVQQFYELNKWSEHDFIRLISILSGCDYDKLFVTKVGELDVRLAPHLKWLEEQMPIDKEFSKIRFGENSYLVPKDIALCTLGQKISLEKRLKKSFEDTKSSVDAIPFAVACYMQPIVTGKKFSIEDAELFEKEQVAKASIVECAAVGNFFLSKLMQSKSVNVNFSLRNRMLSKLGQGLKGLMFWRKSTRLMHSQGGMY